MGLRRGSSFCGRVGGVALVLIKVQLFASSSLSRKNMDYVDRFLLTSRDVALCIVSVGPLLIVVIDAASENTL